MSLLLLTNLKKDYKLCEKRGLLDTLLIELATYGTVPKKE